MSSIVGLQGKVKAQDIVEMLKSSKNRGPDSSGIYLDEIHHDIDLDEFEDVMLSEISKTQKITTT